MEIKQWMSRTEMGDFPGGLVVKNPLSGAGTRV